MPRRSFPVYVTISQLMEMGVMPQEIKAKISGGAWKTARPDPIEDGEGIAYSFRQVKCRTRRSLASRRITFTIPFSGWENILRKVTSSQKSINHDILRP